MKTAVLIGGISKESLNRRFFDQISKLNHTSLEFHVADIASLPFFSQDTEYDPPAVVDRFRQLVESSEAVLFVTPEYNRSIPGVLKNAIDWLSRPPGRGVWSGKPAAVTGASGGAIGTFGAQQHLRIICAQLNIHLMSQPAMYFNASTGMEEGVLTEGSADYVRKFLSAFEEWVRIFRQENYK